MFCGGIQIFPVLATTDPSLATVGVTALLLGTFAQHFLRLGAAQGGCDCLHKSPLHSSRCCLKGCLVNRIIKLSCRQATEINGGPLGMSLIRFTAQPLHGCVARTAVLLKGGRAAPSMVHPMLVGPPGNKEKKDVKLLESVQRKW